MEQNINRPAAERERKITDEVNREFEELESAMIAADPGPSDILKVYGSFEDAIRQADEYLALLNPVPAVFSTTSSSNSD